MTKKSIAKYAGVTLVSLVVGGAIAGAGSGSQSAAAAPAAQTVTVTAAAQMPVVSTGPTAAQVKAAKAQHRAAVKPHRAAHRAAVKAAARRAAAAKAARIAAMPTPLVISGVGSEDLPPFTVKHSGELVWSCPSCGSDNFHLLYLGAGLDVNGLDVTHGQTYVTAGRYSGVTVNTEGGAWTLTFEKGK